MLELKVEEGNFVISSNEKVEGTFPIRDDFEYGLTLLKKINTLKNKAGTPIYEVAKYKQYSLWPFGQHNFYWEGLRYFLHLRPVLAYLNEHQINTIDVRTVPAHYQEVLTLYVSLENQTVFREGFTEWYRLVAKGVGALALWLAKFQKRTCLLYTPDIWHPDTDCDIRFARAYQLLEKQGIKKTEIFHTNFSRKFVQHLVKRKRLALYREAYTDRQPSLPKEAVDCDLSVFSPTEATYLASVLDSFRYTSQASLAAIHSLIHRLKKSPYKVFLALDDVRYVSEIIIACRECGIRSVGIQHGHFTKHLVGWMNYGIPQDRGVAFDTLYLWNDYWQEVLLDYSTHYTKENTEISGLLRPPKPMELIDKPAPKSLDELTVLVCGEPLVNRDEVGLHLKNLLEAGANVVVSVRPDASINTDEKIYSSYGLVPHSKLSLAYKNDAEILNKIDLVVGTYSTFLNEMLLLRKPVGLLETSLTHGHRLLEDNLALPLALGNYEPIIEYIKTYQPEPRIEKSWPASPDFEEVIIERELAQLK